jgi:AcrR family transcriptional regulator
MIDLGAAADAKPSLRADARRNLEKLKAAALEIFQERGLDAPLEEIAERAGVSTGTLYNRFGSREGLIDAVLPDLAAARLETALERALAKRDPWSRFACFVEQICELQASDPAFNDVVSRRYPDAPQVCVVCDEILKRAGEFIADAQVQGTLRSDFTPQDLFVMFWSNAHLMRVTAEAAPDAWRRGIALTLDGLRADAAHALPVGPLSRDHDLKVIQHAATERRSK